MPTINGDVANNSISGTTGDDTIYGFGGDDLLDGLEGNDVLNGGDGSDTLLGYSGNDHLFGENGDDLLAGEAGHDTLDGGLGFDIASYYGAAIGVTVNLSITTEQDTGDGRDTLYSIEGIIGSAFNDVLTGDANANYLDGDEGNDLLNGGAGNDVLLGAAGADTIYGGDGDDSLYGEAGDDRLYGDAGNDTFYASAGADIMDGGAGDDTFRFSYAGDYVETSLGIVGGSGVDTLILEGETIGRIDLTQVSDLQVERVQSQGAVRLTGAQAKSLQGLKVSRLELSTGGVIDLSGVTTLTSNIILSGQSTTLDLTGRPAYELLYNDPNAGFTVTGGAGNDVIKGGINGDTLNGGGGDDTLSGQAGDDVLNAGDGNDRLDGGDGLDAAVFAGSLASYQVIQTEGGVITVTGAGGTTTLVNIEQLRFAGQMIISPVHFVGTDADETTMGSVFIDYFDGRGGEDTFDGLGGDDRIFGGDGRDYLSGGDGNDIIEGGSGYGMLSGGAGNDRITGGDVTDFINGGVGDDVIFGMGGDDYLSSGGGADTVDGGAGHDMLAFDGQRSRYVITVTATGVTVTGPSDGYNGPTVTSVLTNIEEISFLDQRVFLGSGVEGTANSDLLTGTAAIDTLNGYDGDDILIGDDGDDIINGGAGNDTASFERVSGSLPGGVTIDLHLTGVQTGGSGHGRDTLISIENLRGSQYSDTLTGDDGVNRIDGGDGADVLNGGLGADTLIGGVGQDRVVFTQVATGPLSEVRGTVSGGADYDYLDASGIVGMRIDGIDSQSLLLTVGAQQYVLTGFEDYRGGAGADDLDFSGYAFMLNRIDLGGGNDRVVGGAEHDVIYGGTGDDVLIGAGDRVRDDLSGGDGNDTIIFDAWDNAIGENGDDLLIFTGDYYPFFIDGGSGQDTLRLNGGFRMNLSLEQGSSMFNHGFQARGIENIEFVLDAGQEAVATGDDRANILSAVSSNGVAGTVTLSGMGGNDTLIGAGGNDLINGGEGDDLIDGGGGDDLIDGGNGRNRVEGGAGFDILKTSGDRADYRLLTTATGFLLKGPYGSTRMTNMELIQFGDGKMIDLRIQYGPNGWGAFVDGPDFDDQPQVRPLEPSIGSKADQPQVLPADDDFLLPDGPLVLPALMDKTFDDDALVLPGVEEPGGRFTLAADDSGLIVMGRHGPVLLDIDLLHTGASHDPWA